MDYHKTNPPPLLEIGKSPVGLLCLLMKMQRNTNQPLLPDFALLTVIHKLMLSDCIFTPSDSDEEYADSWFNWD